MNGSAVVDFLVDNLKESELELVPTFLANTEIGKDEKGGVLVINVFEVVERGYRCTGEEASAAVVNYMEFRILIVATD